VNDTPSPRFALQSEALRTKKVGLYGAVDYPAGFEGKVELLPAAAGSDKTCIRVTTPGRQELHITELSWKTSSNVDVSAEVLRVTILAEPCGDVGLNELRDRIEQDTPG
jgi:hypothetical protein